MKRLHTFILKSFFGPLVATFFVSLFILLMQFLWKYIDDLAGKGLEWTVIMELMLYASARLVPMALPLAILLSSIMTFGNMGENFELTAIKSAGVSLQKFMAPLIYLTILICFGAFYYSDYVIPYTNLKTSSLIYDVKNQRQELLIKEGIFYNGIDGYSIKIAKKDYKTNLLQNIMIYDHSDNKENVNVTIADSGYMRMTEDEKNIILTLYNGYTYEEIDESKQRRRPKDRLYPHRRNTFEKQVAIFELKGLDFSRTDEDLFKNHYNMYNLSQLKCAEDSLIKDHNKQIENFTKTQIKGNYFKKEAMLISNRRNRELSDPTSPVKTTSESAKPMAIPLKGQSFTINEKTQNKKEHISKDEPENTKLKAKEIQEKENLDKSNLADTNKIPEKLKLDSLFNQYDISKKEEAIHNALEFARSSHNNISGSKSIFLNREELIRRHQIEWHRKFALSFACLVFFFIGAPFGAIVRKGGFGTPVVVSILFFILYYILSISGEKFAREGVLPPYIGMWISSFVLMPLGIFLTYKATTDSVILNTDTYFIFIKKLFARLFKQSKK